MFGKRGPTQHGTITLYEINPSTIPGLKPEVCSGLILSGAFDPVLKAGVWRRRSINKKLKQL